MTDLSQPMENPSAYDSIDALNESINAKSRGAVVGHGNAALEAKGLEDNPLAERLANGSLKHEHNGLSDAVGRPMRDYLAWTVDRGWLNWNGTVWEQVPEAFAIELVRRRLQKLFKTITDLTSAERPLTREDVAQFSRLLSKTKAANVTFFLKGLLTVPSDIFDSQPALLNARNGVVDLRTGEIGPHRAGFWMTKVTNVDYVPGAEHPEWHSALEALPEDVVEWLQVRYGQAATGYMPDDDVLPIQTGSGQNGKSTIVQAILSALGNYGVVVPEKVLLANPGDHPTELMTLHGARLAVIEETPEGHRLPTKRLKDLLGTPVITARAMRQDFVSWDATHSLFLNTNYVPQVAETDHGTWRRLALVKFPYTFRHPSEPLMSPTDKHGIPGLREHLRDNTDDQLEAVLAWIVEGARAWFEMDRSMLPLPLSVQADTQGWREEADLILAYAQERLTFAPGASVPSKEVYEDFSQWLQDTGRQPWNDQTFTTRFGGHYLAEKNRIEKKRMTKPVGVSRRFALSADLPDKVTLWLGVRFNH